MSILFVILGVGAGALPLVPAAPRVRRPLPQPTWYREDVVFASCRSKRRPICRQEFNPWIRSITILTRSRPLMVRLGERRTAALVRTRLLAIAKTLRDAQVASPRSVMHLRDRLAREVRRATGIDSRASPALLVVPHFYADKQVWFEFTIGDQF